MTSTNPSTNSRADILIQGRGAQVSPPNRFERLRVEIDLEQLEYESELVEVPQRPPTEYFEDDSQSIVSSNDSPDVPFRYSLNPYRGCTHGCAYCYARPTHEYLGLSAGLDFETKIFVKARAVELFRDFLAAPKWSGEPIMLSGVTDCYQPVERQLKLTRGCLELARQTGQPMMITTKNALITRDLDILEPMARQQLISVAISITSLDQALSCTLEPRTSVPAARLRAVKELAQAGVPVMVNFSPLIPGLNDAELAAVMSAVAERGARSISYTMLRLPLSVKSIFLDWLERFVPGKRQQVESALRAVREGELNDSEFGSRMRGRGVLADHFSQLFKILRVKHGLQAGLPELDRTRFRSPPAPGGQLMLF